jgi:large subunit ribosomal protein L32
MLPVKKTSKSRTRTRRAHHALGVPPLARCAQCGHAKRAHSACGNCGFFSSRVTLKVKSRES